MRLQIYNEIEGEIEHLPIEELETIDIHITREEPLIRDWAVAPITTTIDVVVPTIPRFIISPLTLGRQTLVIHGDEIVIFQHCTVACFSSGVRTSIQWRSYGSSVPSPLFPIRHPKPILQSPKLRWQEFGF